LAIFALAQSLIFAILGAFASAKGVHIAVLHQNFHPLSFSPTTEILPRGTLAPTPQTSSLTPRAKAGHALIAAATLLFFFGKYRSKPHAVRL
jgi:hypothetical protein